MSYEVYGRASTEKFPDQQCVCCAELECPAPEFFIEQTNGLYLGFLASPAGFDPSIVNAMPPSGFRMLWLTYVTVSYTHLRAHET